MKRFLKVLEVPDNLDGRTQYSFLLNLNPVQ